MRHRLRYVLQQMLDRLSAQASYTVLLTEEVKQAHLQGLRVLHTTEKIQAFRPRLQKMIYRLIDTGFRYFI